MALSEYRANTKSQGNIGDVTRVETEFKKDKVRAKLNFTRSRNQLLLLLEQQDMPCRKGIRDACENMDQRMEMVMEVLSKFSDFYIENKELQKSKLVVSEMEKIEEDYYGSYESAREYLNSRKEDTSSVISDSLSIDLQERMNLTDGVSEKIRKRKQVPEQTVSHETLPVVGFLDQISRIRDCFREKTEATSSHFQNKMIQNKVGEVEASRPTRHRSTGQINSNQWADMDQHSQHSRTVSGKSGVNKPGLNPNAAPFELMESVQSPSIGQDLWRQLKRVQIPVFDGDKRKYQSWKAAFLACIDSAPATGEYKLLQLRQHLSGEALHVIENLGHSETAFEAAKERLERKFGGKRRQIAIYLEELEQFRQIRLDNARDLEQVADLLDIAIINIKEAGLHHELGDGSLYTKLQRKLPQSMLANYHRWIFETNAEESIATLRTWVIQESEFQTIASETLNGFTDNSKNNQPPKLAPRRNNQESFFCESKDYCNIKNKCCQVCGRHHKIWTCQEFMKKNVPERWDMAKRFRLCYRCLADGHRGKSCPRSRPCGRYCCRMLHHRLLHSNDKRQSEHSDPKSCLLNGIEHALAGHNRSETECPDLNSLLTHQVTFGTEGKEENVQTTMTSQDHIKADYIGLRIVPVILKNGDRWMKINALLDDASTRTYVNADVAAELGLKGKPEKLTVNLLNGQVETFETKPISVELKSITGNVYLNLIPYTANRVTGNMGAIDWNWFKRRWPHLRNINFPRPSTRPVVDILIGLNCIDLHCAIKEVKGRHGEPIARLTPLGWTCIGNPGMNYSEAVLHTNFTYFVSDQLQVGNLVCSAKQLDETEEAYVPTGTNRKAIIDDISAIKNCEIWNARGYSQYTEKGYVRESHEQEQSELKTNLLVIIPGKDSTKSGIAIHTSTNMNDLSVNETVHTRPNLQRYLLRYRWSFAAEVFGILERYLRIGRALAYKQSAYSFLRKGSIQNRPLESKYDWILSLIPSTEIARIPQYERIIEAGLAHNRLSSANMFTDAARGVLLQDTWTTGLEKNDRPVEPSLKLARALSTTIRATYPLGKNGATAHQKLSSCLQKRVSTYKSEIMSLRASTGASKYLYGDFKHVKSKKYAKTRN